MPPLMKTVGRGAESAGALSAGRRDANCSGGSCRSFGRRKAGGRRVGWRREQPQGLASKYMGAHRHPGVPLRGETVSSKWLQNGGDSAHCAGGLTGVVLGVAAQARRAYAEGGQSSKCPAPIKVDVCYG